MNQPRGRRPEPIALCVELQARAHTLAGLLSFGGDVGRFRARRLAADLASDAIALCEQLDPRQPKRAA